MMRLFVGIGLGLFVSVGLHVYQQYAALPCDGRCGDGTRCADGVCQVVKAEPTNKKRSKKRRRRGRRRRGNEGVVDETLKAPRTADLKSAARGPKLGGVDRIDMTEAGGRELSRDEVERKYRKLDNKIIGCINTAGKGWQLDNAGKVTVSFRLERSGKIERVRVAAPALMMRAGIYKCIAPLVRSLRYPASARSLIMTYPYRVD